MSAFLLAAALLAAGEAPASLDWPQWRGPGGTGVSAATGLPETWSATENIRWRAALPGRGLSCPVAQGGRVYVTASSGAKDDRLHFLAFDATSGKLAWERRFRAVVPAKCNSKTCMAAPTPVVDGERLYGFFSTCDVFCLDKDGDLLWCRSLARDYDAISNQVGLAASPIALAGGLIVSVETQGASFAVSLDLKSGATRWKIQRPPDLNWVTPLVFPREGGTAELILQTRFGLSAHDPASGKQLWGHESKLDAIPSPVAAEGVLYVPSGEILALHPSPGGAPSVRWRGGKLRGSTASPLFYRGRVYALNSAGILTCAEAKDGALLWQERLKGPYSASPVAADGKIYCVNEDGVASVVRVEGEPRLISTIEMGEGILASPAIGDGALYLRSDRHLWAIGKSR